MTEKTQSAPPMWLMKAFVGIHVAVYRLSGGALGGRMGKAPVALLTVRGRKSGKPMTTPLVCLKTDRGHAVIASFAGAPKHPAWYLNLKAAGAAELEIGRRRISVRVEEPAIGSDRYKAVWRDAVAVYPEYDAYQARTSRAIPVVELIPKPD
jgi:deazaflavin-dependent oxidoreductase (nitroreductase family)